MKKQLIFKAIILSLCLCLCTAFFSACKDDENKGPQKPAFADVINTFDASTAKSGHLESDCVITFYNPEGKPYSLTQSIDAVRTQSSDGYYTARADANISQRSQEIIDLMNLVANFKDIDSVTGYILGTKYLTFKGGYYNGTYNGKNDYLSYNDTLDYMYTNSEGKQRYSFMGFAENDVQSLLGHIGYTGSPIYLKDYLMFLELRTFSWTQYADAITADYNSADHCYYYKITIPGADIKNAVFGIIDGLVAGFAACTDADVVKLLSLYQENRDFLIGLLNIGDCEMTAQVDSQGVIQSLRHKLNINIKITDQQILDKVKNEEDKSEIAGGLTILHSFFLSTKNKEASTTEINFALDVNETYTYGSSIPAIDISDDIFASAEAEPTGRTLYGCIYRENKNRYVFNKIKEPAYED